MSNYIKYGVIIALVFTSVILKRSLDRNVEKIQYLNTRINRSADKFDNLETTFISSYLSAYEKINNCTVTNIDNNEIELKNIFFEGRRLVLCYSELNCNVCIDSVVNKFVSASNKLGRDKFSILANYRNPRDLMLFKRMNNINTEMYNFNQGDLNLPTERLNTPFLFISDSNLIAESVFIPVKSQPELTNSYFKSIIKKFTND